MKLKYLILISFLFTQVTFAQNDGAGNTGLAFLKLGAGARAIAMGEAYSSLSYDAEAIIYNPACMSFGSNNNVMLMHNISAGDLTTDFIAGKIKFGKFAIGGGLFKASIDEIEVRTHPGPAIDKFTAQNLSANLSVSFLINDFISLGVTSKFLYEKIFIDDASGVAFDFGTCYSRNNLNFSFVVSNLGSMNELRNQSTKLPAGVRFGGSYLFEKNNFKITASADGYKIFNGGKMHVNLGGEAGYKDFIFLRAGYQSGYENKNISAGIGLKYKGICLDYAFVPHSSSFGISNSLSIGFSF